MGSAQIQHNPDIFMKCIWHVGTESYIILFFGTTGRNEAQ